MESGNVSAAPVRGGQLVYALEADTFARALMGGWRDVPAMPVADTLGNMATLDRWRSAIGLVYDVEKRLA